MAAAAPIIAIVTEQTVRGMLIRFALSVAVSYITNKLFAPDVPSGPGQADAAPDPGVRQRIASDPGNKLPVIYGKSRVFGSITFADITSDNQTMAFIITLCEGPIETIGQIWWDDFKLTLDSNGNVTNATDSQGETDDFLNGNLTVKKFKAGGRCSPMETFSTKWATNAVNRTMPNVAYLYVELKYNRDESVTGLTSKLGAEVDGKLVRTFSGSTLSSVTSYSNNPAECLLDYLTSTFYGCGDVMSDSDLDLDSFISHKSFCDTLITHTDKEGNSTTAKRYTTNGVINTFDERDLNVSDLVICSQSIFSYNLGKFQVVSDTTGSSVMSFNPDNMYGDVTIVNDGFNSSLNKLNISFSSYDQKYQDDQVFLDLPDNLKSYNEPELVQDTRFKFLNNNIMVQRVGNVIVKTSRDNLIVSFKTDTRALKLQVTDIVSVTNSTYGFTDKLFKINSITEIDMNSDGVSGYFITAQEYNADAYAEEALTEFQTAPNTNLANPRNFGAITNLRAISSDPDSTTPFVQLQWTVPTGLTETFEIYVGDDINATIADREFNISFRTSTGPFIEGATITHKVFDLDFTDTLVFWVRPINQFARGAFSNSYNFGKFRPNAGGITSGDSGIIINPNDSKNPYGVVNRFAQIKYGDSDTGSNIRDGFTDIDAVQQIGYAGTTINTITRTGGTDGSGSVTFPLDFDSGVSTTEEQELSFTGTRGNVTQKELLHINLADDIQNTTSRKTITDAVDWNATGFLTANSSNNSVKVNDTLELASLVSGGVSSGFGRSVCIGTSAIYVMSNTELFSFKLVLGTWTHYATTNSGGVQNYNVSPMGNDVLLYNSSTNEGQIWNIYLVPATTGALGGGQFN
mgnify:FL=1|tara:strand:+ start:50 stop:2623 length:2574 start_codon:yes stop_codon:yes gene_type:complete